MWDVTFQTAVAQAELEARDYPGAYHRVAFQPAGSGPVVHRDHPAGADRGLRGPDRPPRRRAVRRCSGSTVTSPVFGVELPVLAARGWPSRTRAPAW